LCRNIRNSTLKFYARLYFFAFIAHVRDSNAFLVGVALIGKLDKPAGGRETHVGTLVIFRNHSLFF
jgi:hypothetical protein